MILQKHSQIPGLGHSHWLPSPSSHTLYLGLTPLTLSRVFFWKGIPALLDHFLCFNTTSRKQNKRSWIQTKTEREKREREQEKKIELCVCVREKGGVNRRGKLGDFFSSCKPFQLCSGFRTDTEKIVNVKERKKYSKDEQGACVKPSWALVFGILKEENKGRGDCLEITVPEVQGSTWNEALSGSLPSGYSPLTLHSLTSCTGLIGSPYPQPSWTQIPFGPLDFPPSSGWKDSLKYIYFFFLFKEHLFYFEYEMNMSQRVVDFIDFNPSCSVCWRGLDKRGGFCDFRHRWLLFLTCSINTEL